VDLDEDLDVDPHLELDGDVKLNVFEWPVRGL
jgi:hypothetical protein